MFEQKLGKKMQKWQVFEEFIKCIATLGLVLFLKWSYYFLIGFYCYYWYCEDSYLYFLLVHDSLLLNSLFSHQYITTNSKMSFHVCSNVQCADSNHCKNSNAFELVFNLKKHNILLEQLLYICKQLTIMFNTSNHIDILRDRNRLWRRRKK